MTEYTPTPIMNLLEQLMQRGLSIAFNFILNEQEGTLRLIPKKEFIAEACKSKERQLI